MDLRVLISAAIALLTVLAAPASAQSDPVADSLAARVDSIFAPHDNTRSPGCAAGIVRDGALVFSRGYGMADLEAGTAITPRTVFRLYSTSKQFVALPVALLARDGRLSLDDDVRRHVPELRDYGERITLRHLLQHTSGLADYTTLQQLAGWRAGEALTPGESLELLARVPRLNHRPGEAFSYTNSGFFLLSLAAERAAGRPLADFLAERVFAPLGMTHTVYRDDDALLVPGRARGYARGGDGAWRLDDGRRPSVLTTLEDMARWDAGFASATVGSPELRREMETSARLPGGEETGYGFGLYTTSYRGARIVGHGGDGTGGTTMHLRFPELRTSFVVLCNVRSLFAEGLAYRMADAVLGPSLGPPDGTAPDGTPPAPAVAVSPAELRRYEGTYLLERHGLMARGFVVEGDTLRVVSSGRRFALEPLGGGRFRVAGSRTGYAFRARGAGMEVERTAPGESALVLGRAPRLNPGELPLSAYAGTYRSGELGTTLEIVERDGKLFSRWPRNPSLHEMQPAFPDGFTDGFATFRFTRDARGRVDGVVFHQDRVWRLPFRRQPAVVLNAGNH